MATRILQSSGPAILSIKILVYIRSKIITVVALMKPSAMPTSVGACV